MNLFGALSLTKIVVLLAVGALLMWVVLKPKFQTWLRDFVNGIFTHPPEPASTPIEQIRNAAVVKPPSPQELQAVVAAHREASDPLNFTGGGTPPVTAPGVNPAADVARAILESQQARSPTK